VLVLLSGLVVVSACQPSANGASEEATAEEEMAPEPEEIEADPGPSLYERLGGTYAIAAVVDDLIDRLAANEALNANPGIGSRRIPERFPGLKYNLTAMVCQATGGPCNYTGHSMKDAHTDMGITPSDWEIFAADCKATLDKFGVPEAEQQELFDIIGSTQGDIVVAE
jgi:hemoglobin